MELRKILKGKYYVTSHVRAIVGGGKMGRWLSKKHYEERAKLIVKLRDKDKLQFAEIARRMGILQGVVEYSYHKSKRGRNEH